jgi:hypothetical protein
VLATRTTADGHDGFPLRPSFEHDADNRD